MIRTLGWIAATLALVACGTSLPIWNGARTDRAEKEKLVRTTLANGLKVVLLQDHAAPVVALNIWVRVGSADESEAEAGMAHVFEHMLFKGTERREVGEIARTIEAAGGNINAFTSFDMTVYFITMASRDAAVGIDVLSDAVLHSTFDATELAKEQKVVLEEIRRGEDSPGRVLSQAIFASAYQTHPYRLPVIGTPESVTSFTREQMVDFHRRWYVPNNMTFVVVGDFEPDAVLAQIEKAFADAPARPELAHSRSPESPQTEPRGGIVRRDFEQTQVGIAFPITSFRDPEVAYLDLLAAILGGGESSRLYRNVKDRRQLVHAIGAGAYTPSDAGLFFVDATLDPEQLEEALAAIAEEIHRLQILGPSEIELDRARTNLLSHEIHEKETMQGQARKLGFWESLARGLEEEEAYLERIRRATTADVRRVAGQYLVADHATMMALLSDERRPELQGDDLVAAYRAGDRAASALEAEDLGAGILRYTLSNGLRVIVKQNPSVPLVSMRLSFLGGQLVEDEEIQGVSSFVSAMLDRGTEHRSASQIAAEVENIAGGLDGFSGRNSFGLTGEFLTDSLDTGLELFADVLLFPTFPTDEIEKLRTEHLAAIQRREDNLAGKAFELFGTGLFEKHPYRFPSLGSEASVKGFDQDALRQYWDTWAVPSNGVLAIVGDVDPNEVVEAVSVYLGDWAGPAPVELPSRPRVDAPATPRELSIEKGKQQIHIVVGFLGISVSDPDGPALDVLSQVLSGQGGRLFLELRDRQSLAYTVTAFGIEGVDPGSFAVYIASAPDKRDAALEGLKRELQRIVDEPVSDDELERAKGYLIGSQAVSLQRYGSQASLLSLDELYGLGAPHHLEFREQIEAVTAADVQRVARRLIRTDAPVVAIVE